MTSRIIYDSKISEDACPKLLLIIIRKLLLRTMATLAYNSLPGSASNATLPSLNWKSFDSTNWSYTPEVNSQIQDSRKPHLYDVYAREPYNDKTLPEAIKLPLLMAKTCVMREKLNKHYTDFLMEYPDFIPSASRDAENPIHTMPMCSVMKDGGYLTWSSSARTGAPRNKPSLTNGRQIEGMTKNLNERVGRRDKHKSHWACGEQGCQNAIAREEAKKVEAPDDKRRPVKNSSESTLMKNTRPSR